MIKLNVSRKQEITKTKKRIKKVNKERKKNVNALINKFYNKK